jgi:hypothetical protein
MTYDVTNELGRLSKVYGEAADGELLRLAAEPDSLTEAGQLALAEELKRRGLAAPVPALVETLDDGSTRLPQVQEATAAEERADAFGVGVPGMVPAAGAAVEQALEPGGETRMGMTALVSFFDGMQLSQACEALEDAGISPAVQEIEGDATTGTPSRFEIWVDAADVERGKAALRVRLGLFPLGESIKPEGEFAGAELDGEEDRVVGDFETAAEAGEVKALLIAAGIPAETAASEMDAGMTAVLVEPADYERALQLVAERLGLG